MKRLLMAASLMAATLFIANFSQGAAAETVHLSRKQVKELVANAKTPEDHRKLAAYFNQEAARLEADAKNHEELVEMYRSHPAVLGSKNAMVEAGNATHCINIAKSDRDAAKENRAIAASHEEMAKNAGN